MARPRKKTTTETLKPAWAHVEMVRERDIEDVRVIRTPKDIKVLVNELLARDREWFVTVYLDTGHRVLRAEITGIGTINASLVHPREVFTMACLCKAVAIILVHNHPSGDLTPSTEDLDLTERLVYAGQVMGVRVLDHVIVAPNGDYHSMKEHKQL